MNLRFRPSSTIDILPLSSATFRPPAVNVPTNSTLRAFCEAGLMREITVDGSKSYFDTRIDDHPHFYWEDDATLSDAPADELQISRLPDAPEGAEIAKVDVVIRLRRT